MKTSSSSLLPILLSLLLTGCTSPNQKSEQQGALTGDFHCLETAYESGVISDADLATICYFNNRGIAYDNNGNEIELSDQSRPELEPLDPAIERAIIADYTNKIKKDAAYQEVDFSKVSGSISVYCGEYRDYYAVRFADLLNLPAEVSIVNIGGLNFLYPYQGGEEVVLWKAK